MIHIFSSWPKSCDSRNSRRSAIFIRIGLFHDVFDLKTILEEKNFSGMIRIEREFWESTTWKMIMRLFALTWLDSESMHRWMMQDFTPNIHLTRSDFNAFTASGALCDPTGSLGPREFEEAMRRQVSYFCNFPSQPLPLCHTILSH